jgi:hypothetical protein
MKMRDAACVAAVVLAVLLGPPARPQEATATNVEFDAGKAPQSIAFDWSLVGPSGITTFTIDPSRIVATVRRLGTVETYRAVADRHAPFDASHVVMTNYDELQALVHFSVQPVPPGSYAIDIDARKAVRWHGTSEKVDLVRPTTYLYVSPAYAYAKQPDPEIAVLARTYASKAAVVREPFAIYCSGLGISLPSGRALRVARFERETAREIGTGPNGTHAATPSAQTDLGNATHAFVALTAIELTLSGIAGDDGKPCMPGTAEFASAHDVARYISLSDSR